MRLFRTHDIHTTNTAGVFLAPSEIQSLVRPLSHYHHHPLPPVALTPPCALSRLFCRPRSHLPNISLQHLLPCYCTGAAAFDQHLLGVQAVLRHWGADEDVGRAGERGWACMTERDCVS